MSKPRAGCPRCGSPRVHPIADELAAPDMVEAVQAAVYNDAIILGGSRVGDGPAGWTCRACGHTWTVREATPATA